MVKKILLGVGVLLLVLVGVISTRPDTFSLERSAVVDAPPAIPFALLNDFRLWAKWSPWDNMDPTMARTYGPQTVGTGATYSWTGKEVGEGRMTIEESQPGQRIAIRLEFLKPMEAINPTTFVFTPEGTGTRVTWTMKGNNNFLGKAFSLVMDMDKMVGGDFERGLAALQKESLAMVNAPAAAATP